MWRFNGDYDDLEQVKPFYNEFLKVGESIEGNWYNSLFEGKIAGIAGDDESTAIYLLRRLKTANKRQEVIDSLSSQGYKNISDKEGVGKYEKVIQVGTDYSEADTREFEGARVVNNERGLFIVPKRNRTRGYIIYPDSEVYVK